MSTFRFEYRITLAYLIIGALWIIFSDRAIDALIGDKNLLTTAQTYKGWFYVLITAVLFFLFLKKHLGHLRRTEAELEQHRDKLQELVTEKTKDLDDAVKDLYEKNEVINRQNEELRQTLKDLQETQAHLIQSEKMASLGVLTAGVAHEINNPLNYIAGGLSGISSLMQEQDSTDESTELYLNSIGQGIERISSIVSGLNNFSRNTDKYDEACNINEILEHCLVIIGSKLTESILVTRNFSAQPLIIPGNVGQLHQVFINILLNAVQSIENRGTITITTIAENHAAVVEIGDTGCGIEEGNMSKITDPFFTTKEPGEGTGLGLSITYNIIKKHKGLLSFDSEPNAGTIVKIVLPF
jgi:C4-dicarboxylate-specific signal transduction histidine kinase